MATATKIERSGIAIHAALAETSPAERDHRSELGGGSRSSGGTLLGAARCSARISPEAIVAEVTTH